MKPAGDAELMAGSTGASPAVRRQIADYTPDLQLTKPVKYPVRRATAYDPPALPHVHSQTGGIIGHNCPQCRGAALPPALDPSAFEATEGPQRPWPLDEYIWDGGDRQMAVNVADDWTVRGLDQEDTVAHYHTTDGRIQVTPSNQVPIYAPRFASVRQIHGPELHQTNEQVASADRHARLISQDLRQVPGAATQPVQLERQHNLRTPIAMRDQTRGLPITMSVLPLGFGQNFLPYEDLSIIRRGKYASSEKALLAERTRAAVTWASDQMAQAVIEGVTAHLVERSILPEEGVQYELPPGKPRLRLVKVASQSEAQPGETVEFTLRFDNIGDQKIGNVTIIDSLTSRLEYVEGSTECSLKGKFGSQDNDGDSLVLRWEIDDPLEPGQGGVIRFKCRVR